MCRADKAVATFKKGFNCTQAVLSTFGEEYGLGPLVALRVAAAFGGGMGRMGKTCGAVTGAFMVIGLKYGMTKPEDLQSNERAYGSVNEFVEKFKSLNKSIICRELLGYDISNRDTLIEVRNKGLFHLICPKYVRDAVEIVESLIQ